MAIKVLVVDDSALVRSLLSEIIRSDSRFSLVGAAPDAYIARDMVNTFSPDVITLDIEMPRMDGLDFLRRLMAAKPTPVLMISTLTDAGSDATLTALELGAIDYIPKPKIGVADGIKDYAEHILERLYFAAQVKPSLLTSPPKKVTVKHTSYTHVGTEKIIAVGASTGGTEAIKTLLLGLPPATPGILITQHMPPGFTRTFAERLNKLTRLRVVEAKGGERVLPGSVFLAPGGQHLTLQKSGANYVTALNDEPPLNRHKPSVDIMMNSVAHVAGVNALGIILTGMGKDGAQGIHAIHTHGGYTFAQDEATSVVFGMPKEAILLGGVNEIHSINDMAESLLSKLKTLSIGNRL
jgi:two-component system chemotaxis response regulator CheB